MTDTIRTQFLAQFDTTADAIAFEDETLSIGTEFLPACAIAVRDGGEPTADYYEWLLSQFEAVQHDMRLTERETCMGEYVASVMVEDDMRAWRAEGLLDGIVRRHRAGQPVECDWHDRDIDALDKDAVRASYCEQLTAALDAL